MNLPLKQRTVLFLVLGAVVGFIFNSPRSILDISLDNLTLNGIYPWAVLFLCAAFLVAKRKDLSISSTSLPYAAGGAAIVAGAFFLPAFEPEFLVFRLLLAWTGLAFIFFGEAASLPALLLCIYGFGIAFPKIIDTYAGIAFAQFSTRVAYSIGSLLIPITAGDTAISMITLSGERLLMVITVACSGAASMSVFLVIFMLMSLDLPLPKRKWVPLLIFGIIGTSVQNIVRLVLLMLAGYYLGPQAVESGESFAGYVLFPLWYVIFAIVYLRTAKEQRDIMD